MLSIPPAWFAAATSASAAAVGIVVGRRDQLCDLLVADDVGEPVGADQVEIAGRRDLRHRLDLDDRLGADRPGDHRAVRVLLGLLDGQPAGAHELADERVIGRELLEHAVPQPVRARIADVTDRDRARRSRRRGAP